MGGDWGAAEDLVMHWTALQQRVIQLKMLDAKIE